MFGDDATYVEEPTVQLRWLTSPTPGERPTLQQMFLRKRYQHGNLIDAETEWHAVPFVSDWP